MSIPELTLLLTPLGIIVTSIASVFAMYFAYRAKINAGKNTEETRALHIEINHRMDGLLQLTRTAGFAAGQEDQRANQTLPS